MDQEKQKIREEWGNVDVQIQFDIVSGEKIKSTRIKDGDKIIIISEYMNNRSSLILIKMFDFTNEKEIELYKNKIWNMVNKQKLSFFYVSHDYKSSYKVSNEFRTENKDLKKAACFLNAAKEKTYAAWFGIEWLYQDDLSIVIENVKKEGIDFIFRRNKMINVSIDKFIYLQNNSKKLEEKKESERKEIISKLGTTMEWIERKYISSNIELDENFNPIITHYIEPSYRLGWTEKKIQIKDLPEYIESYKEVAKQTELLRNLLEQQLENVICYPKKNTFRWNDQSFQYHFKNEQSNFWFQIEKWLEDEPLILSFSFEKGDDITEKMERYIKSLKLLTIMN